MFAKAHGPCSIVQRHCNRTLAHSMLVISLWARHVHFLTLTSSSCACVCLCERDMFISLHLQVHRVNNQFRRVFEIYWRKSPDRGFAEWQRWWLNIEVAEINLQGLRKVINTLISLHIICHRKKYNCDLWVNKISCYIFCSFLYTVSLVENTQVWFIRDE